MIGDREYVVGHTTSNQTKEIIQFFVTDCRNDEELRAGKRPAVAEFPVSQLYDHDEQKARAEMYAEFLNKINAATRKAYEHTQLLDIMRDSHD